MPEEGISQPAASVAPEANAGPVSAYVTFVVNVHDTVHVDESADTILRLIDLYEKYEVRGDFYVTAAVVEKYVRERPEVIARLKESNMTISYHVRPPHPLNTGFDSSLKMLDDAALARTCRIMRHTVSIRPPAGWTTASLAVTRM